jgi:hypothetical protein
MRQLEGRIQELERAAACGGANPANAGHCAPVVAFYVPGQALPTLPAGVRFLLPFNGRDAAMPGRYP